MNSSMHCRSVTEDGDLRFVLSPMPIPLDVPPERGEPRVGDIYETCPSGEAIVERIAVTIAQQGGAALIIDYGFANGGFGETLQAVSQHKYANVLAKPGEADLSAHVDFAALSTAAERGGAKAYGPIDQGSLLRSFGIAARAERLAQSSPNQRDDIAAAVERLTSPQAMGSLFKALAIAPRHAAVPPGFGKMERC
jgi:NADH dehydrogenase [ubiquinone] 1 alpha subcomplex assembly factor 7